jgi:hypothetical protein
MRRSDASGKPERYILKVLTNQVINLEGVVYGVVGVALGAVTSNLDFEGVADQILIAVAVWASDRIYTLCLDAVSTAIRRVIFVFVRLLANITEPHFANVRLATALSFVVKVVNLVTRTAFVGFLGHSVALQGG